MEKVAVQLGQRSYPILIAPELNSGDLLSTQIPWIATYRHIVIITNDTLAPLFLAQTQHLLQVVWPYDVHHAEHRKIDQIIIPDGEAYKTLTTFEYIMAELLRLKVNRDVLLVALGGGVVGDLTGFAAACYQRGVDFLQIPTTLLAQVDSSVGGKTAVNHPLGKNMIGAFKQPVAVLIDPTMLHTLPKREFAAGMAEVIKYAVLGDSQFFAWLMQHSAGIKTLDPTLTSQMIRHCCQMKADIVSRDETEQGDRALLNLGHTFGHAIEAFLGYGEWLHGEAVAVGMMMAMELAHRRDYVTAEDVYALQQLLHTFDLPTVKPAHMTINDFIPFMKTDKKALAGKMRFILPTAVGAAVIVSDVTESELQQVFSS
jgi:3-dehydroquinate synthase